METPTIQSLEKRIVRCGPLSVLRNIAVPHGRGASDWTHISRNKRASPTDWAILQWPSESAALLHPAERPSQVTDLTTPIKNIGFRIGSAPRRQEDYELPTSELSEIDPSIVMRDSRPGLKFIFHPTPWIARDRRAWSWLANAAEFGGPKSRDRKVRVGTRATCACSDYKSHFLYLS